MPHILNRGFLLVWVTVYSARIRDSQKETQRTMERETDNSVPMAIREDENWEPVGEAYAIWQWTAMLALVCLAVMCKSSWAERLAEKQAVSDKFVRPLCTVYAGTVLWTIWGFRSGTIALIRVFGDRGDFPYLPMWPLPDDSAFLSNVQWGAAWALSAILVALIIYCIATSSWDLLFDVFFRSSKPLSMESMNSNAELEKVNEKDRLAPILTILVGATSICMLVLAASDRMMWLGFFQMFCAFFCGLLLSANSSSPMLPFHLFLVCMYTFAGFQKLNVTFGRDIMPWFFSVEVEGLVDLSWILQIPGAGIFAALTEGLSGLGLLIPSLRKFFAAILCMVHVTIICVLRAKYGGPLPHVDIVWQFACLATLLFLYILPWDSSAGSSSTSLLPKVRWPQSFAMLFVFYFTGIVPLLNMLWGIGDCGTTFNMYSGGIMNGHMSMESDASSGSMRYSSVASGGCFDFGRWQSSHLWVSNQEDIFKAGASYLAKQNGDKLVNLVLMGKPSAWTGETEVRYLTCGVKGCSEKPCQHHCSAKTSSLFDRTPAPVSMNGDTTEGIWAGNVSSSETGRNEMRVVYRDGALWANDARMLPAWCKFTASKSIFDVGGRTFVFSHSDDGTAMSLEIDGVDKFVPAVNRTSGAKTKLRKLPS